MLVPGAHYILSKRGPETDLQTLGLKRPPDLQTVPLMDVAAEQ
jgi:hypothetical protein